MAMTSTKAKTGRAGTEGLRREQRRFWGALETAAFNMPFYCNEDWRDPSVHGRYETASRKERQLIGNRFVGDGLKRRADEADRFPFVQKYCALLAIERDGGSIPIEHFAANTKVIFLDGNPRDMS